MKGGHFCMELVDEKNPYKKEVKKEEEAQLDIHNLIKT